MATRMASFVNVPADSHFSLQNLPYGVFKPTVYQQARPGVAIGEHVLDLSALAQSGLFNGPLLKESDCFLQPSLNSFMAMGRPAWKEARATIQKLLSIDEPTLQDNVELQKNALFPMSQVQMVLPCVIGDYTDFFASMHHTKNCGIIFRGPENPILPNWFHLPVAYHGRASSVVISGTDLIRPRGQKRPVGNSPPGFGPSAKLDLELEMAMLVGPGNELGTSVNIDDAADHIFGLVLMNDWSARDIQAWEAQPLGPFLGKSFGTSISPWIVTLEALEPFACEAPTQDPPPSPYLSGKNCRSYDIPLEVAIRPAGEEKASVVCRSNAKHLYWTIEQQLAHHTINGCNLRPGDLLGSGTISGPEPESFGSLLELSWDGKKQVKLENDISRTFIEDGDEVILSACCQVAETRFASNTIVLRRLVKVKESLASMVISQSWSLWRQSNTERATNVKQRILDDTWWERVEYLLSFTEPIMSMIRFTDMDKPCLGEVYDGIDSMIEKMRSIINEKEQDHEETFFKEVQTICVERWNKMTTPLHLLAFALTPKFYSDEILAMPSRVPPYRDTEVSEGCRKAFSKLFPDREMEDLVTNEFADFVSSNGQSPSALRDKYRKDAHSWWYLNGHTSPHLQTLAIKILSQVASSSSSERNWSTYSFIHSVKRNRLAASKAEELVFVHSNLRLLTHRKNEYNQGGTKLWDVDPERTDLDYPVATQSSFSIESDAQHGSSASDTGVACGSTNLPSSSNVNDDVDDPYDAAY